VATSTVVGFFAAIGVFTGYATGAAFVLIAFLKLVMPGDVGFILRNGIPQGFGVHTDPPPGVEIVGGLWVVPFSLIVGMLILLVTHRGTRALLGWFRRRAGTWRPSAR
jgi:hypothetical protein